MSKNVLFLFIFFIIYVVTVTESAKLIRLCIASVDPAKLSSQCVMCSKNGFAYIAIGCTGITKMNQLIANPLSVQEATCLIYNCRKQVPDIKPEPYHGSLSHAVRTNYPSSASQTRAYGVMPPHGMFGGGYSNSLPLARYNNDYTNSLSSGSILSQSSVPLGLGLGGGIGAQMGIGNFVGGSSGDVMNEGGRAQALPYAIVPATYTSPFGLGARKYKAALVPLFRK